VLNPTDRVTITSFEIVLYPIDAIPTPFEFSIGKIVGVTLLKL